MITRKKDKTATENLLLKKTINQGFNGTYNNAKIWSRVFYFGVLFLLITKTKKNFQFNSLEAICRTYI